MNPVISALFDAGRDADANALFLVRARRFNALTVPAPSTGAVAAGAARSRSVRLPVSLRGHGDHEHRVAARRATARQG